MPAVMGNGMKVGSEYISKASGEHFQKSEWAAQLRKLKATQVWFQRLVA